MGIRFGVLCGRFIYLPSPSIIIRAGVGGASGFTASIRDHAHASTPKQPAPGYSENVSASGSPAWSWVGDAYGFVF